MDAREVEAAVEALVPQARGARLAVYAAGAVLAALLLGFVIWWLLIRPRAAQVAAASAHVEARMAKGTAAAAQETVHIMVDHQREIAAIDTTTERNDHAIHSAAGAEAPAPDVAAALHASLCLRAAYRDNPGCAAVSGPGRSVGALEPDPGRRPAGE